MVIIPPGLDKCPTEFEALRSRREFLYTDYTTTDLPTPPTRNHGAYPSEDNAGFWNYTDDPAWGQKFFIRNSLFFRNHIPTS